MIDSHLKILLIEDNADDADWTSEMLTSDKKTSVEIEVAGRISQALQHLRQRKYHAVLLDLSLPDSVSPTDSFRALRQEAPTVPIVVLTGVSDEEVAYEAVSEGAQDYLVKGKFNRDVLLRSIKYAMERKRAEIATAQAVALERDLVRCMVELAPIPIARLSTDDLCVRDHNNEFGKMIAGPKGAILGRPLRELLPTLPFDKFKDVLTGVRSQRLQSCRLTSDGANEKYCDVFAWPSLGQDGKAAGIIAFFDDVSERVLRAKQRDSFLDTLAHDLKVPVVGNDRILQLIESQFLKEDGVEMRSLLAMARQANKEIFGLIDNLSWALQIDAEAVNLAPTTVDVVQTCTALINELSALASARNVSISTRLDRPLISYADRKALSCAVRNLLHNAVKFTKNNGHVVVDGQNNGTHVELRVQDEGPGISSEHRQNIFKPYWQGGRERRDGNGCGLGLYVTVQLLVAQKGSIEIESTDESGSTFKLSLPTPTSVASKIS